MSPVKPGPAKGYKPPQGGGQQTAVTNNGRPSEAPAGSAGKRSNGASPISTAPPIPQVGFRLPYYGQNNPKMPQPVAVPGILSYNPLSGEWVMPE